MYNLMTETVNENDVLTIYKGSDSDYAYIPLNFKYDYFPNYAKDIINNDGNIYLKKINNNASLSESIKKKLNYVLNSSDDTTNINNNYNIYNNLNFNTLDKLINLYYIENFTYVLDQDSYQPENINTPINRSKYMFTIIPESPTYDIDKIVVKQENDTDTSTDINNKKYDLIINVPTNQSFTLVQVGTTNTYKLNGNLIITYEQSDETIKYDTPTENNSSASPSVFKFIIQIGSNKNTFEIPQIENGYNTSLNIWKNYININLSNFSDKTYTLTPNTSVSCNVQINIDKNTNPLFTKHGTKLIKYTSNVGGYFVLNNINVPNLTTLKYNAYFMQGDIINNSYYKSWSAIVFAVNTSSILTATTEKSTSNIYIILTPPEQNIPISTTLIDTKNAYIKGLYSIKMVEKDYKIIFTDSNKIGQNIGTTEAPIFIYDINGKQTKVPTYITEDNTVFDSYFTYSSNKKFTYNSTVKRNIINISKYYDIIYKYKNNKTEHYCENNPLSKNDDLSQYIGYTFNVMFEKYNCTQTYSSSNSTLKQYSISEQQQIQNKLETIDGNTIRYTESLYIYKLYSFKLSNTGDSNTGVYTYTI